MLSEGAVVRPGSSGQWQRGHGLPDDGQDVPREDPELENAVEAEEEDEEEGGVFDLDRRPLATGSRMYIATMIRR